MAARGSMRVLCDCPERLGSLAPGARGAEVGVDSLPSGEQALWRALGPVERLWRGTCPDHAPVGFWSLALVVAEARDSQFDALRVLLAGGETLPGPTVCLALSGRSFHGHRGRPWMSAPGNLHFCVALPHPGLPARDARSLTMLPAVAVVDAVRETSGGALRPGIKWVNDVLLGGRKIGGVLTATWTQGDELTAALFGLGLNVATTPPVPPTPFVPSVGSLSEAGSGVTLADAYAGVLAALGRRTRDLVRDGAGTLFDAYREASLVVGREVCIFEDSALGEGRPDDVSSPLFRGAVREIAPDLSLILEGVEAPVASGRLAFAESCCRL